MPISDSDVEQAAEGLSPWVIRLFYPPHKRLSPGACGEHGGEQRRVGHIWNHRCFSCATLARARMLAFIVRESDTLGFIKANPPRRFDDREFQDCHTFRAWDWVRAKGFVVRARGKAASGSRYQLAHDTRERAYEAAVFVSRLLGRSGDDG